MAGVYGAILNFVIRLQLHGGITFAKVNRIISSKQATPVANEATIAPIVLTALHMVFAAVVIMLLIVLIINWLDPNRKIVK